MDEHDQEITEQEVVSISSAQAQNIIHIAVTPKQQLLLQSSKVNFPQRITKRTYPLNEKDGEWEREGWVGREYGGCMRGRLRGWKTQSADIYERKSAGKIDSQTVRHKR